MCAFRDSNEIALPFSIAFHKWGPYMEFRDSLLDTLRLLKSPQVKSIDFDSMTVSLSESSKIFEFGMRIESLNFPEMCQEEKECNLLQEFNKYAISNIGNISQSHLFYIPFNKFESIREDTEHLIAKIAGTEYILKESQFELNCKDAECYEESFLLNCLHENVQSCFGHTIHRRKLFLLLEPYEQCLASHLDNPEVDLTKRLKLIIQIAQGLASIHMKKIVHNNLSPYSIFVRMDGSVIIGDFERAYDDCQVSYKETKYKDFSTDKRSVDPKNNDIYSLALLTRYILSGYSCPASESYFTQIINSFPENCPDSVNVYEYLISQA